MTQNVTQWLEEIQALKQQLVEAQKEQAEAYASAINWQRLYETEAQQRRVEADLARQTIEALQQQVQDLQTRSLPGEGNPIYPPDIQAHIQAQVQVAVDRLKTEAELRTGLVQALAECDRLTQALKLEQTNHAQTRKSLTTALGDAIDALSKQEKAEGR